MRKKRILDELPPESFEEVLRLAIVSDEAGVWRLGDATGELKPGRSTIPWPLSPGPNRASLVLEDRAGNRRELALRCLRMPSLRATPETFKVVLTNIPNGGRVVLAAGDYREFNLSRRRLTIVAETPGAVSVLGGDLRALDGVRSELALEGLSFAWEGRDPHKPLVEFRESKVRLRGCRFSSKRRPALFASGASAELTVADCDFHSLDAAIRVVDGGRATVTDSRFKGAGMALSVVTGSSFSGARLVFDGPGVGVITERSAAELRDIEARSTVRVLLRCEGRATLKLRSTTLVARDAGHVGLHLSGGRAVLDGLVTPSGGKARRRRDTGNSATGDPSSPGNADIKKRKLPLPDHLSGRGRLAAFCSTGGRYERLVTTAVEIRQLGRAY